MTLVTEAVAFAAKAHDGMVRKGTKIPYIVHPMEVAAIVSSITDDPEIIAAAILHDVIEDCGVTAEALAAQFGSRVAQLVLDESQPKDGDPHKTWNSRKHAAIEHLAIASHEAQLIALGDKLSNMRAICRDFEQYGDAMFSRFHQHDKGRHAWYYRSCARMLARTCAQTKAFAELEYLIERVFSAIEDIDVWTAEESPAV